MKSNFDSLQEHHRQRVLRSLPRYHPIEVYRARPRTTWGDYAVGWAVFAIALLAALGVFG